MKPAKNGTPALAGTPRKSRPLLIVMLTLALASALLFGISRLGDEARRNIGPRDRYSARFADIRCNAPPGMSRETFLTEVRYHANIAPTFQTLDSDLSRRISAAFAAHPWVASVDAVTVEPPNTVSVSLTFRKPVLAVPVPGGKRAVDAKGVLLPISAPTDGLAELVNAAPLPAGAHAGQPWPDELVVRAAAVAAEYKPRTLERTAQGWQLEQPNGQKLLVGR